MRSCVFVRCKNELNIREFIEYYISKLEFDHVIIYDDFSDNNVKQSLNDVSTSILTVINPVYFENYDQTVSMFSGMRVSQPDNVERHRSPSMATDRRSIVQDLQTSLSPSNSKKITDFLKVPTEKSADLVRRYLVGVFPRNPDAWQAAMEVGTSGVMTFTEFCGVLVKIGHIGKPEHLWEEVDMLVEEQQITNFRNYLENEYGSVDKGWTKIFESETHVDRSDFIENMLFETKFGLDHQAAGELFDCIHNCIPANRRIPGNREHDAITLNALIPNTPSPKEAARSLGTAYESMVDLRGNASRKLKKSYNKTIKIVFKMLFFAKKASKFDILHLKFHFERGPCSPIPTGSKIYTQLIFRRT